MSAWLPPVRRSLRGDERTFGVRGNRAEVVAIFLHDAYSVDINSGVARNCTGGFPAGRVGAGGGYAPSKSS